MNTLNENCYSKSNIFHVVSDTARKLYYYVQWVGHFVCRSDFYIKRSNFDSYLLLYTVRGSAVLNYKGNRYRITPKNGLILIDCREPHEYYPLDDNWEFKFLHFNGSMSHAYYEHITQLYGSPVLPYNSQVEHYLNEIYRLTAESVAEETCSDYIYRILIKLIHGYRMEQDRSVSPPWLTQAIEYISQNYRQDIQVDALAEKFHFSRCYFSTLFKKHTGFSPHQYIVNYRIAEARWLLYNTTLPVAAISQQCGFQNTSSFIRLFKKQEGSSPLTFRKISSSPSDPKDV